MNRFKKIFLSLLVFSLTVIIAQESLAAGFSQGNEFQVHRITGSLMVICSGGAQPGQQNRFVRCDADVWSPAIRDYFVGPAVDADTVVLNSTRADGSQKSKDSKYDGSKGQSKSQFNLGIWTLTQKPLLQEGANQIHFTISKDGQTVSEGDFTTNVTRTATKTCPSGTEHAFGDCNFPENYCDRYFDRYDNCQ